MMLAGIGVPGEPGPWEAVGFTVRDGSVAVANGALLVGADGLALSPEIEHGGSGTTGGREPDLFGNGRGAAEVDGVALWVAERPAPAAHANGAFELDHLVLLTDSLERTSEAVQSILGLDCRRIRETPQVRQAFHRFGNVLDDDGVRRRGCIIEVVERPGQARTALMGVVFNVGDLDAVAAQHGDGVLSRPRDAVQPGRRIAAFRRDAGLPVPVALMTPDPRS